MDSLKNYFNELESLYFDAWDEGKEYRRECLSLKRYGLYQFTVGYTYKEILQNNERIVLNELISAHQDQVDRVVNRLMNIRSRFERMYSSLIQHNNSGQKIVVEDIRLLSHHFNQFNTHDRDVGDYISKNIYDDFLFILHERIQSIERLLLELSQYFVVNTTPPETPPVAIQKNHINSKHLRIKEDIKYKIQDTLKPFFDPVDQERFQKLLEVQDINQKIIFHANANRLGEFFRRLHYNKCITNNKKEIVEWICHWFQYNDGKAIKDFNRETVHKLITSGKGEPAKENLIEAPYLNYEEPYSR